MNMDHVDKLRRVIKASGMTQESLARHLGVSFPTLNSWVNGRSQPRRAALTRIDLAYVEFVDGIPLDDEGLKKLIASAESCRLRVEQLIGNKPRLDKLTLLLTYHTDAIEGSTMTLADTDAVLFRNQALSNRTLVEQLEAKNHQTTLWWLLDRMNAKEFTVDEGLILDLHTRLMNGVITNAGRYRNHGVRIAGTRVTVANHLRIPELVNELCLQPPDTQESLIAFMARQHSQFERIHPFSDGNGRIGRLLILAYALQHGAVPPVIKRERRALYYKALETAQLNEDYQLLEQLIAESILTTDQEVLKGSN